MAKDLFARYIWLMDTLRRYGRISRRELNRRWASSSFGNGSPLPRRTFYSYRQAVEEIFAVNIECDPVTFEYYIADDTTHGSSVTDWLLNSTATNNVLSGAKEISQRIFVEDVPSAREYLHVVIDSLKSDRTIKFDYHSYTRTDPKRGVTIEPYFLKIFRQRWYITGRNVDDDKIKTYALDRMSDVVTLDRNFKIPADFDAEEYCRHSFGIVFNMGTVEHVVIQVDARRAKYFRALPLHPSQQEMIHDRFSMFHYDIRITPDFIEELRTFGPDITVMQPVALRALMIESLRATLANYDTTKNQ